MPPKKYRLLLTVSLLMNIIIFTFFMCKRLYYINYERINPITKKTDKAPGTEYYLNRNEAFTKLPKQSNSIIFLGNSHTQNFELTEIFQNLAIKNRGINRDNTAGILKRLTEITDRKPKKIFIEIGINDIFSGISNDTICRNYILTIKKIKRESPGTSIYIQSVFPTPKKVKYNNLYALPIIKNLNQKLALICKSENVTYIDLYSSYFINNKIDLKYFCSDSLHLSGEGYLLWSELLKKYI